MPDSQTEPDTSAPPVPQGAGPVTGGAMSKPALPPQGGPMGQPAKELGNIAKGVSMARAALKILEEAWSNIRSNDKLGKTLFKVIGELTKELHSDDKGDQDQALQAAVRKQITSRPGQAPSPAQGGVPPQPPTGPIPQPGGAPGPQGA